jgi:hypothetical protein
MLMALDAPHLTLLFLVIVGALTVALVWLLCDLERRVGKRFAATTLARFGYRRDRSRLRSVKPKDR